MRRALAVGVAFAAVTAAGAGCATTGNGTGRQAPDFALPTLGGETVTLSQHRGSVVLLDFWASWCGPCREELPVLERLRADFEPRGVRFVAVSVDDSRDAAAEAAKNLGLTMLVALDVEKRAAGAFQPPVMPSSYVLDRQGVIRFVHQGFRGEPDEAALRRELEQLLAAK